MPQSPAFFVPESLDEAIAQLERYGDEAKVVAGATALTIMLQQRLIAPEALVSLGHIPGLNRIDVADDELILGALVTHREVELSELVREQIPIVAETFGRVASVRVRNAATVGGVVAEADYASDPPALLGALDASVDIVGPAGERNEAVRDFLVAFYETTLQPDEIVTRVRIPLLPADTGTAYEKFITRSSEDRPCVGVAAVLRFEDDRETVADLRVSVGAAAEIPQRFDEIESSARGRLFDSKLIAEVADGYADAIDPLTDMRGSAWYRTEMVRVFVGRALEHASGNALGSGGTPR
jgi:aerobic carbon-monoxide dehydrogenase medium subunit